jgi:hypothetical protein
LLSEGITLTQSTLDVKNIAYEKNQSIRNLYNSGIGEEFIALQLDIEIPYVIGVLKEFGIYKSGEE